MADLHRTYEIRCPVHGFITLNAWERDVINHPSFQRLRRIRQLAWTDLVYPGAMHTRFEHSLGVMHTASRLYEAIRSRYSELLRQELGYTDGSLGRARSLVRLAGLLHDVGHSPFSHSGEGVMPAREDGEGRYGHEDYSVAVIRRVLSDVIDNHPGLEAEGITAENVAALIEGSATAGSLLFWRNLISGQMDADRMDYLRRDSLHLGVSYGQYDWQRILNTVAVIPSSDEGGDIRLGITKGGWHAAEGLILARYAMFSQVYFHKTRVAYDNHYQEALGEMLPDGHFSSPTAGLAEYLEWDDWKVLGALKDGKGGEHGERIVGRNHYRMVYHTPETPVLEDLERLEKARGALGDMLEKEMQASASWYKTGPKDIDVLDESDGRVRPLSHYSKLVEHLEPSEQVLLYANAENVDAARRAIDDVVGERDA